MLREKLRVCLVAVTAAMIALPELSLPLAAMPLAQPGARPAIEDAGSLVKIEPVAYRRKFKGGGHGKWRGGNFGYSRRGYGKWKYGNNRYWKGNKWRYGNNRYWKGKRYGYNRWNNNWCGYGRCKYRYNNYGWYNNNGWYNNPWPWFAAGAAIGIAGAYAYDDYDYYDQPYYGYGGGDVHVRWCLNRYRSYDPASNTYMGYDGYRHRCRGPY